MIRKTLPMAALVAALSLGSAAWAADPTLHEVYQAAEAGHLDQAETMMQQVLRDHPDSAKAHFVEAELLARAGRTAGARTELANAQRLDPQLSFAKPGALGELRAKLGEAGSAMPLAPAAAVERPSSGFGWWPLLIGVLALVVIVRIVRGAPGYPAGAAPGYGSPMAAPGSGMGSGILGGLATGAAVGAGVVAGEALMHRVLDGSGHRDEHGNGLIPEANAASLPDGNYDMGGSDFGVSDSGSWDSGAGNLGSDDW
jgi:uncharacterized protein